jgi:hypothetical protein
VSLAGPLGGLVMSLDGPVDILVMSLASLSGVLVMSLTGPLGDVVMSLTGPKYPNCVYGWPYSILTKSLEYPSHVLGIRRLLSSFFCQRLL